MWNSAQSPPFRTGVMVDGGQPPTPLAFAPQADGGELRIFDGPSERVAFDVSPQPGTLLAHLPIPHPHSLTYPHSASLTYCMYSTYLRHARRLRLGDR